MRNPTKINRAGIVLITSDKGLCGGLNANASKVFFELVRQLRQDNTGVEVCTLGQKGLIAANRLKIPVTSSAVALGDIPKMEQIIGPLSGILKEFFMMAN